MADDYLDFLAGHVFDHDKLVTYKWLSKELQVHVNKAKQMLWEFYEKHRENSDIDCTYLLMGTLSNGTTNGVRVEVVRETDLSKAKEKYSKIISQHLYSVHRHLEDLELLAGPDTSGDVKYSAIKCDACVERTDEEMHLLRWRTSSMKITEEKATNSKPVESTNNRKIDKSTAVTKKNGFNNFFNTAGKQKSPETSKTEKDQESEEKNSKIADLDKEKGPKKKSPLEKRKSGTESSKKVSPKEEAKKVKKGGLDNFFGKMSSLPKPVEIKTPEKREDQRAKEEAKKEVKEEAKKEVKEVVSENKKVKEKEKPRGKKRVRSQGSDSTKKRKRIMVQSDSSDSEAENDMDVEEPMPEAVIEVPTRPKSPSPPPVKHENGKRKILKMVNETYKDDRGFIVTKKVHVYVSCSEDEEEEQERKKREKGPPPASKKAQAKVDNMKKKQTTLMKFFKAS